MKDEEAQNVLRVYNIYRDYMKHEDSLLAHRLSWLLGATGLIAAAYGSLIAYVLHQYWEIVAKGIEYMGPKARAVAEEQSALVLPLIIFSLIGISNARFAYRAIEAAKASTESFPPEWKKLIVRHPDIARLRLPALKHGFSDETRYTVKYSERICVFIEGMWWATLAVDLVVAYGFLTAVFPSG